MRAILFCRSISLYAQKFFLLGITIQFSHHVSVGKIVPFVLLNILIRTTNIVKLSDRSRDVCLHVLHEMENLNCDQCSVSDTSWNVLGMLYILLNSHYEPFSSCPTSSMAFTNFSFFSRYLKWFSEIFVFCAAIIGSQSSIFFFFQDTLLICLAIYLKHSEDEGKKFNFKSQTNTSASKAH